MTSAAAALSGEQRPAASGTPAGRQDRIRELVHAWLLGCTGRSRSRLRPLPLPGSRHHDRFITWVQFREGRER